MYFFIYELELPVHLYTLTRLSLSHKKTDKCGEYTQSASVCLRLSGRGINMRAIRSQVDKGQGSHMS